MTADEIAAMQADALAGTPGEWQVSGVRYKWRDSFSDKLRDSHSIGPDGDPVGLVFYGAEYHSEMFANARRIARVPRLETAVTAQVAELAELRVDYEGMKLEAFHRGQELATERQARARILASCQEVVEQAEADQIRIQALVDDVERLRAALESIIPTNRLHGITPDSNGRQIWHDGESASIARAALVQP